ncbi:hypothetical protein L2E82_33558 [Cichorium intybus]|uniref:Uncharacterized protein n=1 Tax=Cichorium intybus TaxID=13427 RepID=A0ACB9BKK4_CICIN|nr:hypothetical protein L2E82_33558 [Cichorium intybus]
MGSKGRLPPPHHLRRPPPGPGIGHHDPIPPEIHPQHGRFPPFDMLPHPEIMEQKLAAQHVEMQKLATENQRLAATHGTLRHDLAAIQHELQMLHNHIGGVKSDREHQIMILLEKIGKLEADLQGAEPLKLELHKARTDAQNLLSGRDELVTRVQKLTEDHQRAHMELQQVPALISELDMLRQEYQHCRQTYEYEKKVYNDHLESLQVMEKNYMTMASEVEKLRGELKKHAEIDRRAAGPYGGFGGYNEKEASGQNAFESAYGVAGAGPGYGPGPAVPGYDVQRGGPGLHKGPGAPAYDPQRGPGAPAYDPQRGLGGPGYEPQRYDPHRGPGYDPYRGPGGHGYDLQRRGSNSDAQDAANASYGSVAATGHGGSGFQGVQPPPPPPAADGNHPARR